jgi:hypothetical protein
MRAPALQSTMKGGSVFTPNENAERSLTECPAARSTSDACPIRASVASAVRGGGSVQVDATGRRREKRSGGGAEGVRVALPYGRAERE